MCSSTLRTTTYSSRPTPSISRAVACRAGGAAPQLGRPQSSTGRHSLTRRVRSSSTSTTSR
eukprot:11779116-Heterocapsa_arctica.AAC.1